MGSIPGRFFLVLGFFLSITCISEGINDESEISPNYTSLVWNVTYRSIQIKENNSGFMNGCYDSVKCFVNFIMPEALPHGVSRLKQNENIISHILSCIWFYRGMILFLLVLTIDIVFLIYGIVKTISSLIPSRKTYHYAAKSTPWKNRILKKYGKWMQLGWIHSIFTLLVFMIALSHNSNEDIDQGTKLVSVSLDNSFMDIETYIDTTTEQLEILLTNNLEEYLEFFIENSERTAEKIIIELENSLADINLFEIFGGIEKSFKSVEPILSEIKSISEEIMNITNEIEGDLNSLGRHIPCVTEKCLNVIEGGKNVLNGSINELGKGIDVAKNLTSGIIGTFKDTGNLTAEIGGKAIEKVGKLKNLTTNVVGNVFDDLGKSTNVLTNITSSIGGEVIEGGKVLDNLTENIGKNVVTDLGKTKETLTDLTSSITGVNFTSNIDTGVDKLKNFTENIGGSILGGLGNVVGGIGHVTDVEQKGKNSSKVGGGFLGGIDNVDRKVGGAIDSLLNFGKSDDKDVTKKPATGNVVNDVSGKIGGALGNLFSFGNKKPEVTNRPHEESTIKPEKNSGGDAMNNLFDIGGKKSETVSNKPRKDEIPNVVGGMTGEIGGTLNNIFDSTKPKSVNSERNELGGLFGGGKKDIEGAEDNFFNFAKNEDVTNQPKSATGVGGATNSLIDFRNGGTEDVTETSMIHKMEDKIGSASKNILNVGKSFFGFRRKRQLDMNLDSMIDEFRKISSTINELLHFVNVDVKNMKNVSVLLSPVVKEVGVIIRRVLNEVKKEIKLGAKPLKTILDEVKKIVNEIKHQLLAYMKVFFDLFQFLIHIFEPFRYFISYFLAYSLLLAFTVLIIGITSRIVKENNTTDYIMKGGCISLYSAALIMVLVSLFYVGVGIASQKFLCETFQDSKENGVLELIDEMNPAKLGPYVNVSLRRIIHNCQRDKSLYEVADLQKIFKLEEVEEKYLNVKNIEEKLQQVLNFPLNFSKILPLENFQKAEEILFGSFKNVMDSPVISTIETLKNEIGSLPGIGDILKTFTDKIMSFEKSFNALKSVNKGTSESFFEDLENSALSLEKELMKLENNVEGTIRNISSKLQQTIVKSLTMYVEDRLISSIEHSLGRCKPLSIALNTSVEAVCGRITTPANGHWFSWFVCVTISIIILLYSMRLKNISRKHSILSKVYHVDDVEMNTIPTENEGLTTDVDESRKKTEMN